MSGLGDVVRRLRPGSKGEPISKVTTTGSQVAAEAAKARILGSDEPVSALERNWTVALGSWDKRSEPGMVQEKAATPIPRHAPDDPAILQTLFRINAPDI